MNMLRCERLHCPPLLVLGLALLSADLAGQHSGPATGRFRIAGKVVNALGGSPLRRARVTIRDTKNPKNIESTLTSDDGNFEFRQLGAGKYALSGAKGGFIASAYEQHERFSTAIVTGSGVDTEHLVLRLAPDALLGGTVLDESGEPVRRAKVSLYREDKDEGVKHTHKVRTETTDDQGLYEFSRLMSGTYFLSAIASPWYAVHHVSSAADERGNRLDSDRSLDVTYPEVYYKEATESDGASPITVRGGDRLEADIHLNPVPAMHLILRLGPDHDQFFSPRLERSVFDDMERVPEAWEMVSPGLYEIAVAPGLYSVRIPGPGQTVELGLDLKEDGQEIDSAKGEPDGKVKASVRTLGGEPPRQFGIVLRNSMSRAVAWKEIDGNGEVEFDHLPAGKYEVLVEAPRQAYSLLRISSGGAETADDSINVPAGRSLQVSLLVAGSSAHVEGVVKRNGHPVAGAMVVLLPRDAPSNRTLFRRDQSNLDGSFSLVNVMPGSYSILAIADGWDLDWSSPAVIRAHSQHAMTITLGDSQGLIHLPDAVEVEGK
jgi:hypothetical protein